MQPIFLFLGVEAIVYDKGGTISDVTCNLGPGEGFGYIKRKFSPKIKEKNSLPLILGKNLGGFNFWELIFGGGG